MVSVGNADKRIDSGKDSGGVVMQRNEIAASKTALYLISVGNAEKRVAQPSEGTENPAVNHHASSEYITNSPELKKEKPKEDTPV